MKQRVHAGWVAVGAFAVIGGNWLVTLSFLLADVRGAWLPYVAHGTGAALAGAMMATHAPLRPWREPLFAGVLAIAMVTLAALFPGGASFRLGAIAQAWEAPWLLVAIAGASGLGALGGATLARRFTSTVPNTASMLVLSALVITGTMLVLLHAVMIAGGAEGDELGVIAASTIGVMLGGFLTQRMVSLYRPWAAGGGAALYMVVFLANRDAGPPLASIAIGVLIFVLFGALGARWARRWAVASTPSSDLPPAQLR